MINPRQGLSGISGLPITIKALNDGKVNIDGENKYITLKLEGNSWFVFEGFNVHHSVDQSSVVTVINNSNNNVFRRIIGWEAGFGNVNIWNFRNASNNLIEDCAGWGSARKIFGSTQNANNNTFRRCFGRWEGCITEGPKKIFTLSYNSFGNTAENCIATWDSLKMPESYNVLNYDGSIYLDEATGNPIPMTNYTVYNPEGMISHDGWDAPYSENDEANIKVLGCISYIKQNQKFHNFTKRPWAGPLNFSIKKVEIKDCVTFIEPGPNHQWVQNGKIDDGYGAVPLLNKVSNITRIGGVINPIDTNGWTSQNNYSSPNCTQITSTGGSIIDPNGSISGGAVIKKRYVNGVLTNEDLWPWPMNQRIIDAMTLGGYVPVNVTETIFGLCGKNNTVPTSTPVVTNTATPKPTSTPVVTNNPTPTSNPTIDNIILKSKEWIRLTKEERVTLETELNEWKVDIDYIISKVRPNNYSIKPTGKILYQGFTDVNFSVKYPGHQFHMYVPAHYNPSTPIGLIFWMHGGGSYEVGDIDKLITYELSDEISDSRSGARTETDKSNYILVVPIAPFGNTIPHPQHASRWDSPVTDQYLMDIITEINTHYNVNYNKVVVAGFSMGGIGAYHHAFRLNDRVSAIMASAGSWEVGSWDALINTPVYLIHGTFDAYYNSSGCRNHNTDIQYAKLAHQLGSQAGNEIILNEYPAGHGWDSTGQKAWSNFINGQQGWVTTKERNPYTKKIIAINPWKSYETGSNFGVTWKEDSSPHTLWVSIDEIGNGTIPYDFLIESGDGSCSSLSSWSNWSLTATKKNLSGGKVNAIIIGNDITLNTQNVRKMSIWIHPNMVDISQPISVFVNNNKIGVYNYSPSLLTALKSYERRWDWNMIYHFKIDISIS